MRVAAATALAAGLAAPLVRRRLRLPPPAPPRPAAPAAPPAPAGPPPPPPAVTATAATAPFALCLLVPRSRARDVAVCVLQMWAYVATYKMPHDDPAALERRVRVVYPV